jgi:hypothetical protein
MPYDGGTSRRTITPTYAAHDFGTGSDIESILALPTVPYRDSGETQKFNGGRVVGVCIRDVTELFAGTTKASIQVGDGTTPALYFDSGDIADADLTVGLTKFFGDDGSAIDIPAGAENDVTITFVSAKTGPTGIATADLTIDLF